MDEFVSISVWMVIIFLILNSTIFWFANQEPFTSVEGLGIPGITKQTGFVIPETQSAFFGIIDCSTVTADPVALGLCFIQKVFNMFEAFVATIVNFVFAWKILLDAIFPDAIPGVSLFKELLIIILTAIQFFAFFVVIMRVGAIIRGVS